jgi:hypothetical protein
VNDGRDSDAHGWMRPDVFPMLIAAKSDVASLFHFVCHECGFTDAELGPADIYEDHCEICLQEGRSVRLKCWPVEGDDSGTLRTLVSADWSALPRRRNHHRAR